MVPAIQLPNDIKRNYKNNKLAYFEFRFLRASCSDESIKNNLVDIDNKFVIRFTIRNNHNALCGYFNFINL